jgi:hypothetical protein
MWTLQQTSELEITGEPRASTVLTPDDVSPRYPSVGDLMDSMNIKERSPSEYGGHRNKTKSRSAFLWESFYQFLHWIEFNELLITEIFLMGDGGIEFQQLVYSGCSILISDFPTLGPVAVSTVRTLHGSCHSGHATLYLFQKHLFCWEYIICTSCEL